MVAALEAKGSVTYGHIILPTEYLALVNKFTKAELDAANIPYLNVVAQNGIYTDDSGNVTVGGISVRIYVNDALLTK